MSNITYIQKLANMHKKDEQKAFDEVFDWALESGMEVGAQYEGPGSLEEWMNNFIEEKMEEIEVINEEEEPTVIKMKMPDYIEQEWVDRERLVWAIMQLTASARDDAREYETRNYLVIPTEHLDMVVPDSWADVHEGEGMLMEEKPQQLYRKTSMWETFAWGNAIDTDDFQKGPAVDVDEHGNPVIAPQDSWETVISGALENMQFADKCYA